jgi:hypothetical protein
MKRLLLLSIFCIGLAATTQAQFEVKINPVSLLFSNVNINAEVGLTPNFGIDFGPVLSFRNSEVLGNEFSSTQFGLTVNPRYYFTPKRGIDKFYVGAYAKFLTGKFTDETNNDEYSNTRLAVGFNLGYKIVTEGGFLFDIGFGLGRAFINEYTVESGSFDLDDIPLFNIDLVGILAVGYRF